LSASSSDLITNKRSIETTVLVEDGETIVLGGLIDDDIQESIKKVPVLGDIPLLGRLFRSTSISRTKRNLMVFLRPTIVRSSEDVRSISNRKYNYFQAIENDLINSGKTVPDIAILKELLESGNNQ
jgi:general secretion pathway protein D